MDRDLHIAIAGLGRMGKIYARAIADMDGAHLYAVATAELPSETVFLRGFDVPHLCEDAAEALALADVDAVLIATPTSTHRDLVVSAAAAGKAIFCEKPLALTLEDTRAMIDAVANAGVPLQVGFMRRFDPAYLEAKAAVDAGTIGRPITFKSVGRDPSCPDPDYADPARSGGLIIDMAIHDMDLARWFMDAEIACVTAEGTTLVCRDLQEVGDIDNAVVNLRFENGAIGNVEVSRNAVYGYDIRTEVLGSKAAVRVGHADHGTQMLAQPDGRAGRDYLVDRFGPAYRSQIRYFVRCIREGLQPQPSGQDALAAFEIALAATYAAETGSPVSVDSVRSGWTPTSTPA